MKVQYLQPRTPQFRARATVIALRQPGDGPVSILAIPPSVAYCASVGMTHAFGRTKAEARAELSRQLYHRRLNRTEY